MVHVEATDTELPPSNNNEQNKEVPSVSDNSVENSTAPIIVEDETINTEILEILGADPSASQEYGPDINKEVATRFTHIATSGLDKEVRKDLIKKYLVPENCVNIAAPQLNLEIKAALTEQVVKRDKAIEARQKQMAAGISALGKVISDQLSAKDKNNDLIKELMDIGRMFCDIQHSESEARRNFALYTVKKDLKEQLSATKIDKFLFGSNFTETIKTAKAVSKSSSDLKPDADKRPKPATSNNASNKYLNWKARTPARRQPPAQAPRHQQPAAQHAPPRATSSNSYNYKQRPKPARRH